MTILGYPSRPWRSIILLPGFAAAGRAGDTGLSAFAVLGLMLVEHRLGGGLPLGAELGAVVAAPLEGGGAALVEPAETRHHVAGVEFVGALGRLEIRPVVRLL